MADQLTRLTAGQIAQFDNQSPASQNVKLGQLLDTIMATLNSLMSDDSTSPSNPPPTSP